MESPNGILAEQLYQVYSPARAEVSAIPARPAFQSEFRQPTREIQAWFSGRIAVAGLLGITRFVAAGGWLSVCATHLHKTFEYQKLATCIALRRPATQGAQRLPGDPRVATRPKFNSEKSASSLRGGARAVWRLCFGFQFSRLRNSSRWPHWHWKSPRRRSILK
jgi:hypothetical protein